MQSVTLVLLVFLFGLCGGGMDVAMNTQAALIERQYGRPLMSSFHGMWSVAGTLGAAAGGLLASRAVRIELHFLGVVAVALVGLVLASRWLVSERAQPTETTPAFALPPRALVPLGVIAFSVLLCEGAVGDWSSVYLRERLASSPALAAAGFVVFSGVVTVGRLAGDWLTQWLGPAVIVCGGGLLVAIGTVLVILTTTPLVAILGYGLIGAGIACPFPLVLSAASRTPHIDSGRAIAAVATVGYTGSFLGPPLIGTLAERVTLRGALGLLSLVGIIMLLVGGSVQQHDDAHAVDS